MSIKDRITGLQRRLQGASFLGGRSAKVVNANYEKYRNLVRSLRGKAERVAFTERDPRVNLLVDGREKNLYFIQFVLAGDAIEDAVDERLVLRNEILSQVHDEFERNDAIRKYEEALAAQRQLILRKNYYVEMPLVLPEFDFDNRRFDFEFDGLLSNRSIALHDVLFIWDVNLTRFKPTFRFTFDDPDEAKQWKYHVADMRLGIVFHVVTQTPKLWDTGMPATICYVVGFAFVDGVSGKLLEGLPVEVSGTAGPHEQGPKNRAQIIETVNAMLAKT